MHPQHQTLYNMVHAMSGILVVDNHRYSTGETLLKQVSLTGFPLSKYFVKINNTDIDWKSFQMCQELSASFNPEIYVH